MQKIVPFLWFDTQAEDAAHFYVSVFKNSSIENVSRFTNEKGLDQVMSVTFMLDGHEYNALNGGPVFTFSPAISFFVNCEDQAEVDRLWNQLSDGGEQQQCGWLKDKYGISWQIIPTVLGELLGDEDPVKAQNVMEAMLTMNKIDIAELQKAYRSE